MSPQRGSDWVSGVTFLVRNDNCVYCAFLGWQPNEFSISLFQRCRSKAVIDDSRKLHGCKGKQSFFSSHFSNYLWHCLTASVKALRENTWAAIQLQEKAPPSAFMKTANNLRVAPRVPALTGHTTPCHSAVSGSVTTAHSLTPLAGAAKSSKMCLFQEFKYKTDTTLTL